MELHTRLRACWVLCDRGTRIFEAKLAKWMRRAGEPLTKAATNWGSQFSTGERLRCQGTLMLASTVGKKKASKKKKHGCFGVSVWVCNTAAGRYIGGGDVGCGDRMTGQWQSDCADPHQVNKRIIPVPASRRGRPMGDQHGRCFVPEL
ncbi:uncharacterized protein BO96DRAFT_431018 [Aspergillus niger CBS 101883]|uniref:uncharacterized protein n=1 Tax=Aspergillus lacticoffeatus (strain CBS 101883) TaxID=1450533 RepID=UPI000D7F7642|nr:uncharacterized protein BO96DRAFT_431018 [Aspergillus niger CBS 101883]PYH59914.1 hypothetical protein BO96DRAFT_431018 [Aspergillus niger CBS 101883]